MEVSVNQSTYDDLKKQLVDAGVIDFRNDDLFVKLGDLTIVAELRVSPEQPRKTWDDVRQQARTCPVLARIVKVGELTDLTHEELLTEAVLFLSRDRAEMLEREVERVMNQTVKRG